MENVTDQALAARQVDSRIGRLSIRVFVRDVGAAHELCAPESRAPETTPKFPTPSRRVFRQVYSGVPVREDGIMHAIKAEATKWRSARNGRQSPVVVLKRLSPLTLLASVSLRLIAGSDRAPATFPLMTAVSVWWSVFALVVPTLTMAILDFTFDASAWRWLGRSDAK